MIYTFPDLHIPPHSNMPFIFYDWLFCKHWSYNSLHRAYPCFTQLLNRVRARVRVRAVWEVSKEYSQQTSHERVVSTCFPRKLRLTNHKRHCLMRHWQMISQSSCIFFKVAAWNCWEALKAYMTPGGAVANRYGCRQRSRPGQRSAGKPPLSCWVLLKRSPHPSNTHRQRQGKKYESICSEKKNKM